MPTLLHIDCSIRQDGSVTREITAIFAEEWRRAHPGGTYVYRDLGSSPIPHVDEAAVVAGLLAPQALTGEQRAARAVSEPLIDELRQAGTILLGVPMYNYSIPSALKAWFDRVTVKEHMIEDPAGEGLLTGKRTIVVSAQGGSYAPGTPHEHHDFHRPYLQALLEQIGLGRDVTFVHAEMTLAHSVPALAPFRPIADASREEAVKAVRALATGAPA
ncbi:FMN-dependent NADH-azoreductase [Nonomuraea jiangxiensis]|uniref:FMN dependent NADH:quinone oxidoreductase n=1 Tax=Nonomuraea jiangxiensis TaxID=633440 RepID=A0A1G8JFH3_9ACTN|nr:NAD(P)H-dependent oxidoreductase [Nonomuraea jiangxiensis]SDI30034.1 FMN-dependent NADH-azoreductase [Nonomuraea jiangxiensis]